eukprot:767188-Hanusia_phi.AAC.17
MGGWGVRSRSAEYHHGSTGVCSIKSEGWGPIMPGPTLVLGGGKIDPGTVPSGAKYLTRGSMRQGCSTPGVEQSQMGGGRVRSRTPGLIPSS